MLQCKQLSRGMRGRRVISRVGAAGLALLGAAGLTGCTDMSFLITPVSPDRKLVEHTVSRDSAFAGRKVALVEIDGVISSAATSGLLGGESDNPVAIFKERLDLAANDAAVKAVVLRINSPGGGVTASDMMYEEVRAFKARTKKPVVTAMLDVAASGGYYVACASDRIYANPTTITGSIGVIMLHPDISGTLEKIGAHMNAIKSGAMKDSGSPFRSMTDVDRLYFQKLIDEMYQRFLGVVAAGRPKLDPARIRELADGRVYLAAEAKANGLIDEIGTLDEAIGCAKSLAGMQSQAVRVVSYGRSYSYRPNVYAEAPGGTAGSTQVNLINIAGADWLSTQAPRFMYLWTAP